MKIDLSGRNALVTGGATGIGRECAVLLAKAGANIIVADINLDGAQETIGVIGHGRALRCDLGDPSQVESMGRQLLSEMDGVDILVNCAGLIVYSHGIQSVSVEEWDRVLDVNLRGTYLVCRVFMEAMKARGRGKIINFSSLAARVGGIEAGIHYAASKAGVIGFTRTLAKECGPFGINVNAVAPGVILTAPVKQQIQDRQQVYVDQIPLRRLGKPRDVANVVLFLASSLSDYITGAVLDVNGGIFIG